MNTSNTTTVQPKTYSRLLTAAIGVPVLALGLGFSPLSNAVTSTSQPLMIATADDNVRGGEREVRGHRNSDSWGGHDRRGGHNKYSRGEKGKRGGDGMKRMFRGLDLSEAQRDQLFALRHGSAPIMRQMKKEQRAARQAMRALSTADQFNQQQVDAAAAEVGRLATQMAAHRAKMMFDMRAVLTAEQRAKLTEQMESRKKGKDRS